MTQGLAYGLFSLGASVCALNFYLSFVRYHVFALRRKVDEYRWRSGFPVVGSALVVVALVLGHLPRWAVVTGVILALVDTGGIHWFVGVMIWQAVRRRC